MGSFLGWREGGFGAKWLQKVSCELLQMGSFGNFLFRAGRYPQICANKR
jgi:hypothetical protein